MAAADIFAPLIGDVAVKLLGEPDHSKRNGEEMRWGSRGSFKVDVADGVWFDNEAKEGGGTIDLVIRERRCGKAGAIKWLEDQGLIEPREEPDKTFYDYRDEAGAVLFRVERLGKGKIPPFIQHGPDGNGGFVSRKGCMRGVRIVPYRLPELIAADPARMVFVCEGEKDADRLAAMGLIATTNPGGAGKWLAEFSKYLAGRTCIVPVDNDQAGRDHAADVLAKIRGHAKAATPLVLPDLPDKGDVSDWLNAGGTKDKLRELTKAALAGPEPEWLRDAGKADTKAAPQPAYMRGISAAALMAKQFEPVNYVIPGLLAEGATLFAGKPKIGKSWLCYDFALAIAAGRPVFGKIPVHQGDVLYLALEDSERRLKSRLLKKGIRQAPERLTLVTEWPGLDDGCIAELEAWAEAVEKPSLIIVDVLKMVRGVTRNNEGIYDADYRALAGLAKFARDRGIAVLIVHHTRKMESDDPLESISGTNGLTGAADTVLVLKRDIGTPNCILYVRGRDVEEAEKAVTFERDTGTWLLLGDTNEVGRSNERQAILDVLRNHDKPLTPIEVSDILGKNKDAIRQCLTRMWNAGEIDRPARGQYTCHNGHNVPSSPDSDIVTPVTGGVSSSEGDPFDPRG